MNPYEKHLGTVFDERYRIDRMIGIGGMAVVFEAYDLQEKRTVAVKLLRDEISNDVQSVKRFINESKAVSMMNHPNIVRIYDVAVSDTLKYIVMERIDGITLKKYMNAKKALSFKVTMSVAEQVLCALEHAHKQGVIHRDIKPQNIMLLRNGKVVVTDFGIAKLPDAENVTMADKAVGTVYYISPEQASGKPIDARSDLYSLGAMMYEMITGKLPFTADSPVSVALKQVNEDPIPPTELLPSIPKGLEQIILCAMRKRPEQRFQSASQMLEQVRNIKDDPFSLIRTPGSRFSIQKDRHGQKNDESGTPKKRFRFIIPAKYHKENGSMLPIILGVCLAFLIVAVIAAYYVVDDMFLDSDFNFFKTVQTEELTVKPLVGTVYNELSKSQLEEEGYRVEVSYDYSNEYAENVIITQSPEAGAVKKKNQFVLRITVSRGQDTETMPSYISSEYRKAKNELLKKGYQVVIEKRESDAVKFGYVISTTPAYGEALVAKQTVTLVVSNGSAAKYVVMPDLVGKTEEEAALEIINAGLHKGDVKRDYSDEYPEGTVIYQETPANTSVPEGFIVNLTLSKGKKYR